MIERAVLEDFWGKEKELDRWMYEWMYEWSMPFWAWPADLNRRLSCNAKRGCCMDKTFAQDRVGMEWNGTGIPNSLSQAQRSYTSIPTSTA